MASLVGNVNKNFNIELLQNCDSEYSSHNVKYSSHVAIK